MRRTNREFQSIALLARIAEIASETFLCPEVISLDQVSNLNKVRAVKTQRIYGIPCRECSADPLAIVEFLEMILKIVCGQINESDASLLEIRGWPPSPFNMVAWMASIKQIIEITGLVRKHVFRSKMVKFKVFLTARKTLL
jgi:hypothetical protein